MKQSLIRLPEVCRRTGYGKDLAHDLIAWAQETAVRATKTRTKSGEADDE